MENIDPNSEAALGYLILTRATRNVGEKCLALLCTERVKAQTYLKCHSMFPTSNFSPIFPWIFNVAQKWGLVNEFLTGYGFRLKFRWCITVAFLTSRKRSQTIPHHPASSPSCRAEWSQLSSKANSSPFLQRRSSPATSMKESLQPRKEAARMIDGCSRVHDKTGLLFGPLIHLEAKKSENSEAKSHWFPCHVDILCGYPFTYNSLKQAWKKWPYHALLHLLQELDTSGWGGHG